MATFESRITLLESKLAVAQVQLAANTKADAVLANSVHAQEGALLTVQALAGR